MYMTWLTSVYITGCTIYVCTQPSGLVVM